MIMAPLPAISSPPLLLAQLQHPLSIRCRLHLEAVYIPVIDDSMLRREDMYSCRLRAPVIAGPVKGAGEDVAEFIATTGVERGIE